MSTVERTVTIPEELVAATQTAGVRQITVRGNLPNGPSVRLAPGQTLRGEGDHAEIRFASCRSRKPIADDLA